MSNEPASNRIVEQRGDETVIILQEGRWDRVVDGSVQSMIMLVWIGVETFILGHLLAALGLQIAPFGLAMDRPPVWAALILLIFAAGIALMIVPMISSLFRMLFGKDRIVLRPGEIRVRRSVGPFGRERVFSPDRIEWIGTRHKARALCFSVASKKVVVASLGTRADRRFLASTLQERYGLKTASDLARSAGPAGWEIAQSGEGFVSFRDTLTGFSLIFVAAAISLVSWFLVSASIAVRWLDKGTLNLSAGDAVRISLALGVTIFSFWVARRSRAVHMRRNEMVIETKFGPWKLRRSVSNAWLRVSFVTSKKAQDIFTLEADSEGTSTIVFDRWNDPTEVVALARALARHTGWKLEIAPQALEA